MSDLQTTLRRDRSAWLLVLAGIFFGVATSCLVVAILVGKSTSNRFSALFSRTTTIDTSAPSVVEKIRALNRLESVDYSIDKIVEGNRQAPGVPAFLAGDRLLLIAHGEVIAGVDLSKLDSNAVHIDGTTAHVKLPPAQILVTRIDNTRTRVYERSTGILVPTDPNLETQVRQAAEQQITQAALDDKILDKATQNARVSVTGLLYALGFRTVDVQ